MALQVVSPAVSVYKVTGVKDGAEQTEEHTFKRGELLPSWVSPHQQFVLSSTGMARQVGDFPDPSLVAAEDMPAPVVLPEHSQRAVVNDYTVTKPREVVATAGQTGQSTPAGELPADGDTKPVWERAAEAYGIPRAEAEAMRKGELVAEVKKRHAERESAAAPATVGGEAAKGDAPK